MEEIIKPGKVYYWIGLGTWILGVIAVVMLIINVVTNFIGEGHQVIAPGEVTLDLENEGTYTIFHEYRSTINGRYYNTSNVDISGLEVTIYNVTTDEFIQLRSSSMNSSYSVNSTEGVSIFEFDLKEPAKIRITSEYVDNEDVNIVLNVKSVKVFSFVIGILAVIGCTLLFGITGLVIIIVTYTKRRKCIEINNYKKSGDYERMHHYDDF